MAQAVLSKGNIGVEDAVLNICLPLLPFTMVVERPTISAGIGQHYVRWRKATGGMRQAEGSVRSESFMSRAPGRLARGSNCP